MEKPTIVIDSGSAFSRSGFAGEEKPSVTMKTTYLTPDHYLAHMVSGEGNTKQPQIHPLKHGIIMNWEAMENLWSHLIFCGLKVSTEEHPILMSDSPSCPTTNREKMAEVLFEGLGAPALNVTNTGFLSLFSCGRVTGLAVEVGAGVSHVTPIYSGQTCIEGTNRLDVAGWVLCKYMHNLLMKSSNAPIGTLGKGIVTQLKNKYCYVSMDYEAELQDQACQDTIRIVMPDGHQLTLGKERFCCPEPLFRPHLLGHCSLGLHHLVFQSLKKVPGEFKGDILNNVVLSGGSSLFLGFPERMCLELDVLFHGGGYPIKLLTSPVRGIAAWLGGSIVASLSSFRYFWMTKEDYQEHGAAYVHEKFK